MNFVVFTKLSFIAIFLRFLFESDQVSIKFMQYQSGFAHVADIVLLSLTLGHDNSGVFSSPAGAAVDQSTEADAVDSKSTTIAADLDAAGQSDSSGSVEMAQEAVELNEVAAEEAGEADETAATAVEVAPTQSAVADVDDSISSDHEVEQLMKLPETVTEFVSKEGVKVYLVGTAHFSVESQEDVAKVSRFPKTRFKK